MIVAASSFMNLRIVTLTRFDSVSSSSVIVDKWSRFLICLSTTQIIRTLREWPLTSFIFVPKFGEPNVDWSGSSTIMEQNRCGCSVALSFFSLHCKLSLETMSFCIYFFASTQSFTSYNRVRPLVQRQAPHRCLFSMIVGTCVLWFHDRALSKSEQNKQRTEHCLGKAFDNHKCLLRTLVFLKKWQVSFDSVRYFLTHIFCKSHEEAFYCKPAVSNLRWQRWNDWPAIFMCYSLRLHFFLNGNLCVHLHVIAKLKHVCKKLVADSSFVKIQVVLGGRHAVQHVPPIVLALMKRSCRFIWRYQRLEVSKHRTSLQHFNFFITSLKVDSKSTWQRWRKIKICFAPGTRLLKVYNRDRCDGEESVPQIVSLETLSNFCSAFILLIPLLFVLTVVWFHCNCFLSIQHNCSGLFWRVLSAVVPHMRPERLHDLHYFWH